MDLYQYIAFILGFLYCLAGVFAGAFADGYENRISRRFGDTASGLALVLALWPVVVPWILWKSARQ